MSGVVDGIIRLAGEPRAVGEALSIGKGLRVSSRLALEHVVLACLLILFVCRAVFVGAIVPLWQGPDAPVHVSLVALLQRPDGTSDTAQREVQAQILASMARHRWWAPYGEQAPDPLPSSFRDVPEHLGVGTYAQPLYYGLGVVALNLTRPADVESAEVHLRALSVFLFVAALVFGWLGTRRFFGSDVAMGATAVAALHPQFVLTSITPNPDALVIALGGFVWWQLARLLGGHRAGLSCALVLVAAAAMLLTKRSGLPVALLATAISVIVLALRNRRSLTARNVALAGGLSAAALLAAGTAFAQPFWDLMMFWRDALSARPGRLDAFEYVRYSVDNFWLVAGWLRFPAPEPWLWVVRILTIVAFAGAAILPFRRPDLRTQLAVAWLFVATTLLAVVALGFWRYVTPDGRHVFVGFAPVMALLWMGLTKLAPAHMERRAAFAVLALMALLDVAGVLTVLIPAYVPIAIPHS